MIQPLRLRGSFRYASTESQTSSCPPFTEGNCSVKLILHFRYASAKPRFSPRSISTEESRSAILPPRFSRTLIFGSIRVHCSVAFRQTHSPLPLGFHRMNYTCLQHTNRMYVYFVYSKGIRPSGHSRCAECAECEKTKTTNNSYERIVSATTASMLN